MLFSNFGESSVDLEVVLWPLVEQKNTFTAQVREAIYDILNANNIEIPFPQQDVNIRSIVNGNTPKQA